MQQRLTAYIGLIIALFGIWLAYSPGLAGGFLFDDFGNLPSLGATGPIDNEAALVRYLTSGTADPTGRPITVASFLIDARDWPADPRPFKRTNLLIHLLNTVLLAGLLLTLGRFCAIEESHARYAAVLGATLWGLHPFFVSTTLYIVQREAMLPATFVLASLLVWLQGRKKLIQGQTAFGLLLELAGIGLGTVLATLSKANGVLLPIYALLIEHLIMRRHESRTPPRPHRIVTGLLWLSVLGCIAYLLHIAISLWGAPPLPSRGWTLEQRLLTEPRILWEYLRLLWLPHPFTTGLFNDQIHASISLTHPASTWLSILGIGALIASAWLARKRWPLWSLAILFFFAGHLIESTVIPLELYFEHRNYLPALLLFWPLSIYLAAPGQNRKARLLLAGIVVCGLGLMTHAQALLWGNTADQTMLWAQLNPDSPRAQANAAQFMTGRGHPAWTQERLRPLLKQAPNEIQVAFNLLGADCRLGGVPPGDMEAARFALATTRQLHALAFHWIEDAIEEAKKGSCPGLTLQAIQDLLDAAMSNPVAQNKYGSKQDILNLRAKLALANQQPLLAYQYFAEALLLHPRPDTALTQAATLGIANQQKLALCELELWERQPPAPPSSDFSMARLHEWVLTRQNYWKNEVAHLKANLISDIPVEQQSMACPLVTSAN